MRDVLRGLSEKLVNRHPHVFGDAVAETPDAVIEQWDDLKARERGSRQSALAGIPEALPALAQIAGDPAAGGQGRVRVGERGAGVG